MNKSPEFTIANTMPLRTRMNLMLVLAVLGIALQISLSPWIGWLFVLSTSLLGMLKGRTNVPKFTTNREWKSVTVKEFDGLLAMLRESTDVKKASGIFSLSSGAGCLMFLFIIVLIGMAASALINNFESMGTSPSPFMPLNAGGSVTGLFILDAATLLLPIWMSGSVKSWEPSAMRTKIDQLMPLHNIMTEQSELTFQPNLQMAKTANGSVPVDVKMMVKLNGAPEDFYGIQIQTTMNTVQSTQYPYTYCVLIAKPALGLIKRIQPLLAKEEAGLLSGLMASFKDKNSVRESKFPKYGQMIVETKTEGDVEIAVVRQNTTGVGYTTSIDQAAAVFNSALDLAREVVK